MTSFPRVTRLALIGLVAIQGALPVSAAQPAPIDTLHAAALDAFRQGRFPLAYGRFIELANHGHPASARYALWMCEHGLALFGKNWDCAPHETEVWVQAAGGPSPGSSANVPPRAAR